MNVEALIGQAAALGATDLHLCAGVRPKVRLDGQLRDLEGEPVLTPEDTDRLPGQLGQGDLPGCGERDFAVSVGGRRIRANLFRRSGQISAALRILADQIPELDVLGLPDGVEDFAGFKRGIVLVTGETGSGKSTTLAAVLRRINETRSGHIITLEDPIEYIHHPVRCLISQREIGADTDSYASGLRAALREDPNVILIGEMRDLVTIETALTAAETGHLVFATLHTNSASDSIDRMVDVFPGERQRQIRMQLSMTLQAVLTQQLLPRKQGGMAAACELMMVNPAIRNLIREGKTPQIANVIGTSAELGSITMDHALVRLYQDQVITAETARQAAHDLDYVKKNTLY